MFYHQNSYKFTVPTDMISYLTTKVFVTPNVEHLILLVVQWTPVADLENIREVAGMEWSEHAGS